MYTFASKVYSDIKKDLDHSLWNIQLCNSMMNVLINPKGYQIGIELYNMMVNGDLPCQPNSNNIYCIISTVISL